MEIRSHLGIAAGLLSALGIAIYIVAILRGTTVPNKASRFIWLAEDWILLWSYSAIPGTDQTIWVLWSFAIGSSIIFPLSIWFGTGGFSRLDKYCLLGAGTSLLLWWFFNQPLIALLANLGIDFFGFLPTFRKTALEPCTEDKLAWTLGFTASALNLMAVNNFSFGVLIYPVYVFLADMAMMFCLYRPGRLRLEPNMIRFQKT